MRAKRWSTITGTVIGLSLCSHIGSLLKAEPFYQDKTLTVVVGTSPGGTGDFRARASSRYLQKHLPGNPAVVYKYIRNPVHAANYMAKVAKRDGRTIIFVGPTIFSNGILRARGVRYQPEDFTPLGSPYPGGPYILLTRPDLHLNTIEQLKAYIGMRFAQRSVGHSMYNLDRLMAYILELKEPKWVLGYSSQEVNAAVERGEADAQTTTLPGFLEERGHLLKQGFTVPVVMKNTKGIPGPALREFKEALQRTWRDPEFAKDYKRMTGETTDPMRGEEIEANVNRIPKDPKVMATYKRIIDAGPLPPTR